MDGNQGGSRKMRMVATGILVVTGRKGKKGIGKGFLIYLGKEMIYLLVIFQKNEQVGNSDLVLIYFDLFSEALFLSRVGQVKCGCRH